MLAGVDRARTSLLIVCHGNLCRSPMAEALVRHHAVRRGAGGALMVESAGTSPFLPGGPAHPDTLAVLREHGIDATGLACRGVTAGDFARFDRILAVDRAIERRLAQARPRDGAAVELLLRYGSSGLDDVPDPYVDGRFREVFDLLDDACRGLVEACLRGLPGPGAGGAPGGAQGPAATA